MFQCKVEDHQLTRFSIFRTIISSHFAPVMAIYMRSLPVPLALLRVTSPLGPNIVCAAIRPSSRTSGLPLFVSVQ